MDPEYGAKNSANKKTLQANFPTNICQQTLTCKHFPQNKSYQGLPLNAFGIKQCV
jgi:hypothetical protein